MGITLEGFSGDCHQALMANPGKGGVEKVRQLLEVALKDEAFVQTHLGPESRFLRGTPAILGPPRNTMDPSERSKTPCARSAGRFRRRWRTSTTR